MTDWLTVSCKVTLIDSD